MAPVENSYAAADSQGIGFSIDIGGLDAKMQAGAIFTGTEYKDGLFFIDREGNYLFSLGCFASEEDMPAAYDADESTVSAKISDGKVYVTEHDGGGRTVGSGKVATIIE